MSRALTLRVSVAAACLVVAAACGSSPTAPTASVDTPAITTPVNVSFVGAVGANGTVSRTFVAQIPGTAKATLGSIAPATALSIGLGVPRADGSGCLLAYSSTASNGASAEVSGPVATGTFCVQVFAPAQLATAVNFTVSLQHP